MVTGSRDRRSHHFRTQPTRAVRTRPRRAWAGARGVPGMLRSSSSGRPPSRSARRARVHLQGGTAVQMFENSPSSAAAPDRRVSE